MKKLRGYTLAEIVVTMVIIAVVAGISIKIARAKLDSIITYTYYTAYSTLKEVATQMIIDFNLEEYAGIAVPPTTTEGETCESGQELTENKHDCQNAVITVPRVASAASLTEGTKQKTFCEKFVEYVNTNDTSEVLGEVDSEPAECAGDSITSTESSFAEKKADVVLRNGMRIYNLNQNAINIGKLNNILPSGSYPGIGNTNRASYTIYVDIDGSSGPSTKWKDVFPFYITLSGKTIPAYNTDGVGGNDRKYLQTSASKTSTTGTEWLTKSVSFKESACVSGYIPQNNEAKCTYCGDIGYNEDCDLDGNYCRMHTIKPLKGL